MRFITLFFLLLPYELLHAQENTHEKVAAQKALQIVGCYDGPFDGVRTNEVFKSIQCFQRLIGENEIGALIGRQDEQLFELASQMSGNISAQELRANLETDALTSNPLPPLPFQRYTPPDRFQEMKVTGLDSNWSKAYSNLPFVGAGCLGLKVIIIIDTTTATGDLSAYRSWLDNVLQRLDYTLAAGRMKESGQSPYRCEEQIRGYDIELRTAADSIVRERFVRMTPNRYDIYSLNPAGRNDVITQLLAGLQRYRTSPENSYIEEVPGSDVAADEAILFFDTLRSGEQIKSIYFRDFDNLNDTSRRSILLVWVHYVEYFDEYCFDGRPAGVTDEQFEQLQLLKRQSGGWERTRTNERTNQSWTTWRVNMKSKFLPLYSKFINNDIEVPFEVRLERTPLHDDIETIIQNFRCISPYLNSFENSLLAAVEQY